MSLNQRNSAAIAEAKQRIQEILMDVRDQELALALVARLANDFLVDYRQSNLSRSDTKDVIEKTG